jgi:hypothetical protein
MTVQQFYHSEEVAESGYSAVYYTMGLTTLGYSTIRDVTGLYRTEEYEVGGEEILSAPKRTIGSLRPLS